MCEREKIHEYRCLQRWGVEQGSHTLELEFQEVLSCPASVLGTDLGSFVKAASVFQPLIHFSSPYVEFLILLPSPDKCWDYKHTPPYPAPMFNNIARV